MHIKFPLIMGLAAALLVPVAYAHPENWYNDPSYSFESGYIGLLLGSNRMKTDVAVNGSAFSSAQNFTLNKTQFSPGLAAGYGASWQRWYFGVEASTLPVASSTSITRAGGIPGVVNTNKVKVTNFINLDFMPGYYITSGLLAYGRLGAGGALVNFEQQLNGVKEYQKNYASVGVRAGLGFDAKLTDTLSLGLDYTYNRYSNQNFTRISSVTGISRTFSVKSTNNQVAAHLRYNFS